MESIWTVAQVGQLEFAATSTLLAIKSKQQSLFPAEQSDDESDDEREPEDDEEDDATSKPTPRLATCNHGKLINKFLDRLAEVFSCEKSLPKSSNRQDSENISATAWIQPDGNHPLTVIVAKNRGFLDDRDVKMLASLKRWLRLVTLTSHCPSIQTDGIWAGEGGLVEYSRGRLWCHICQVQDTDEAAGLTVQGDVAVQIADMQRLCRDIQSDSPVQQFNNIVIAAYDKRLAWKGRPVQEEHKKAVRAINMLGRLRAAYECFKSVALTFDDVQNVEIEPVAVSHHVQLNASGWQTLLQNICADLKTPKEVLESKAANKYKNASALHVHAEMQILVSLGRDSGWHKRAHPYIGVSKKLCFLCDRILRNYSPLAKEGTRRPAFRTRQCHMKVYPLWTLPVCEDMPCISKLSLATAVMYTHSHVRQKVQQNLQVRLGIAESSAGVTSVGSLTADLALQIDQYREGQRPPDPVKMTNGGRKPSGLGRKIKTVRVGLLPADGSDPRLVPIAFHALSKATGLEMFESGQEYVPDFGSAWLEHQFDRRYRNITFESQASKDWNGEYRLYWNENDALPDNETIKKLLNIERVETMRRFWYGDVFIMRYSEHPKTFEFDVYDLPFTVPECRVILEKIFRDMWENEFLEAELVQDRYMEEHFAKSEADKYIIWQRMTPVEREILSRMPPGTLDYLAITACDDGATRDHDFEKVPEDPTMVRMRYTERRSALGARGWTGFSSEHV